MSNPSKESGDSLRKLDANQLESNTISKDRMGAPTKTVSNKETYEPLRDVFISSEYVQVGQNGSIGLLEVIGGREPYTFELINNSGIGTPSPPPGLEDLENGQFLLTQFGELFGFNLNSENEYTIKVRVSDRNNFILEKSINIFVTNNTLITNLSLSNNILKESPNDTVLGTLSVTGGTSTYKYYAVDVDGRISIDVNSGEISVSSPKQGRMLFQKFQVVDANNVSFTKYFHIFTFNINYEQTPNANRSILVDSSGDYYTNANPLPVSATINQFTSVSEPNVVNLTAPVAGDEYSYTLPVGIKRYKFRVRNGQAKLNLSYVSGESGTNFWTVNRGAYYEEKDIDASSGITLFYQTTHDNSEIEILYWE